MPGPSHAVSRRTFLSAGALALAASAPRPAPADDTVAAAWKPRYCFNTSCIMGQKLPLRDVIQIVAEAGYDGIEPWIREIQAHLDAGGTLADLRKQIADAGLKVESAIGFANWIVDDDQRRAEGLEQFKRDMELVAAIGGMRIAAPPAGANRDDAAKIDLFTVADRYRAALEAGAQIGVVPQIEIWGPSANLSRLGEAVFAAVESGHPDACVLPDIYHIYRGGSGFAGLKLLSGPAVHVFHVNDYPTDRPRQELTDADRVYPGHGKAPLSEIVGHLRSAGFSGALSLELFNRDYWADDPRAVAKTGLETMQAMAAEGAVIS